MTKRAFKSFVRKTLKTAISSKDEVQRLSAVRVLAAMVLAQEFSRA